MTNKKSTKRAFLMSMLSLLLCVSMFVGTTFAWFTDEVTSTNNIIKSGSLDVEMYWGDKADAINNNAEDGAIFGYKYWEPGYTEVKYVTIKNVGDLAFKFKLNIIPNMQPAEGEANLADVIDVYMFDVTANVDRAAIDAATPVGTLSELMADADGAAYGYLLPVEGSGDHYDLEAPRGEISYCIVLKMQETAGNEYQNLSVGEGFSVQLLATQYTWENDSFDHTYDDGAEYDEAPKANVEKMDPEELAQVTQVKLMNDNYAGTPVSLDTAYVFTAPETGEEAAENPYAKWHADFVVTFDRDVTAEDRVGLAGQYTSWSDDWFGALADETALNNLIGADLAWVDDNGNIPAGAPIRLLSEIIGVTINYYELCDSVEVFKCGAWAEGTITEPLTMTVELRLYEAPSTGTSSTVESETGEYIVIGTYTYTFEG